jgi:MFS family permease
MGARVGVLGTVLVTECGPAAAIVVVTYLPLTPTMVLLPFLGMMLNGTSSVLYGMVPEMTASERTKRGFALFYTGTIASEAISPVFHGFPGDRIGIRGATFATVLTALAILPLAFALCAHLASGQRKWARAVKPSCQVAINAGRSRMATMRSKRQPA